MKGEQSTRPQGLVPIQDIDFVFSPTDIDGMEVVGVESHGEDQTWTKQKKTPN